jgi:hypothetical protein
MKTTHWGSACAAAIIGTALASAPALAGPKLFAYLGTTMTFNGTTETTNNGNVDPFVVELFSAGHECLRIAVTAQGADLEATLVAPDGLTWRDDDGNGSLRPLIKAITTTRGWHILRLSQFAGQSVNADFTVNVARLASGDASCSGATQPALAFTSAQELKPSALAPKNPKGGASE